MSSQSVLTLNGTLIGGPPSIGDCSFPSGTTKITFGLCPSQKRALALSGPQVRTINSPSSYIPLDGVGTGETVTQAETLYLRTTVPILVRITTFSSGGDVVSVIPVQGVLLMEFDPSRYL